MNDATTPLNIRTPHRRTDAAFVKSTAETKALLRRGEVVLFGLRPIDHIPDGLQVIGAAVLVVEIVGVLPHVHAEDWRAFDAGDGLAHDWAVLIRRGADLQLATAHVEPDPARAETAHACGCEFLLKLREVAEGAL